MKKFFALSMALVMALSLMACGSKKEEAPAPAETPAATEQSGEQEYNISVILKTTSSEY